VDEGSCGEADGVDMIIEFMCINEDYLIKEISIIALRKIEHLGVVPSALLHGYARGNMRL
jgi:hypothetical protein